MSWDEFNGTAEKEPLPKPRTGYCRNIARKELNRFYGTLTLANLPIDVESICAKKNIPVEALQQCDNGHSAIVIPGIKAIGYNVNHHPHRTRFSIAHELGHFLLGHDSEEDNDQLVRYADREADIFAGELLVPLKLLKEALNSKAPVDRIVSLFNVSKEVIFIQLKEHRLLNKI